VGAGRPGPLPASSRRPPEPASRVLLCARTDGLPAYRRRRRSGRRPGGRSAMATSVPIAVSSGSPTGIVPTPTGWPPPGGRGRTARLPDTRHLLFARDGRVGCSTPPARTVAGSGRPGGRSDRRRRRPTAPTAALRSFADLAEQRIPSP
jgi:hypothetical protein